MRLEYNNSKISPLADKQAAEGEILIKIRNSRKVRKDIWPSFEFTLEAS